MANAAPLQTILAKVRRDEHHRTDLLLACTFSDAEVRSRPNGAQRMHLDGKLGCAAHTQCMQRTIGVQLDCKFGPNYHLLVQTTIEVHVNQDSVSQEGGQSSLGQFFCPK